MDFALEVHNILIYRGKTLSIAESCTGGLISHMLTEMSGASSYLLSSVVAYSAIAKERILKIDRSLIEKYGTISPEIALEMAKSVSLITNSDYSIATTGNLGPKAIEGKELGLLYIALFEKDNMFVKELKLTKDRKQNKNDASMYALKMLYEHLLKIT
ncbi:MAG TPA: CinA family protein [Nitrospirae bacterium]|nr:CinA family protein [Nitrospirota bacterium]